MTRKLSLLVLAVMAAALLAGCATTDDPHKGGLFSYDPEAYQRRLDQRRANLDNLQQQQQQNEQTRSRMEEEKIKKQRQQAELKKKIARLDADVAGIEARIRRVKLDTDKQRQEYGRIMGQLDAVKAEIKRLRGQSSPEVEAGKKQVKELQQRLDSLLEEAEELSRM